MTEAPPIARAEDGPVPIAHDRHGPSPERPVRSILLISWYFPPANAVAAIRLGKMARFFERAGHRLRVVTADEVVADRSLPVEIDDQAVMRTRYWDLDRRLRPADATSSNSSRMAPNGTSLWQSLGGKGRHMLGQAYRDIVLYPDRRIDWSFTLLPALFRMIRSERPDIILVSGPPFSSFIGAAVAAWWFDIPWIAEFRDRWVDDPYAVRPRWRVRIDGYLERLLVRSSAGIVTVSDIWSRFYAGKYGLPTETVMNGFDPIEFQRDLDPPRSLPLRVLHAGTIYPGRRDPAALLEAVRRQDFSPDDVQIQFYGRDLRTVEEQAERLDVSTFVELHNAIPYRQAIALQKRADILLLLQWNNSADEGNVPAKIFEYLATNRQVLGLGPLNGVPARLVRERKAGFFSNDPDEIASQLRGWIDEKRRTGKVAPPTSHAADGLERDTQYQRLEGFCQTIIAEERERRQTARAKGTSAIAETLQSRHFAEVEAPRDDRPTLTVIIDTEADFDWHAPFSRDDHGTGSILHQSRAQRLFDRFGIKPTYLIDYPVATDPKACAVLRSFVDNGTADVGIQLHPWTNPPFDELLSSRNSYPCNLSKALQRAKIELLIDAVRDNLSVEPKVFKAGRYGFNDDTADILEDLRLEIDTSVVPFTDFSQVHGPNFEDCPHRPFWFGRRRPLLELPVTRNLCGLLGRWIGPSLLPLIQSRAGLTCHLPGILARSGLLDRLTLTPEGMELDELKHLTDTLMRRGERMFSFVFHSPSLVSGNTPYVRNEAELGAFLQRIEAYLHHFTANLGGEGRSALEIRDKLMIGRGEQIDETASVPGRRIKNTPQASVPRATEGCSHAHGPVDRNRNRHPGTEPAGG